MSDESFEDVHVVSGGGMASSHPSQMALPVLVGPSTADERNTIRDGLQPVACWRMDDIRFEFDSSFVKPEAKEEMAHFARLKKNYPNCPVTLFGHADPVGNENYNKQLSGRRAKAIYALLTRKTELWEELYKKPYHGDNWGIKSIQTMLTALGHYEGPINGVLDTRTRQAVKDFQGSPAGVEAGLGVDGDPGKNTRPVLYREYMDLVCADEEGNPFQLDPGTDFLARGADAANLKGDIQGCSEFNPVLLFSKEDEDRFKRPANKAERDAANVPNRRVVAFLFHPGTQVAPADWPCPKIVKGEADAAGIKVCKSRFWADHEARRETHLPGEAREYKESHDTFACRFYDRLARRSPCEAGFKEWVIRVLKTGTGSIADRAAFTNETFVVTGAGALTPEIRGRTDANGVLRFKVAADTATMRLKIADMEIELQGGVLPDIDSGNTALMLRLLNLGYGKSRLSDWNAAILTNAIKSFQKDHAMSESGSADETFKEKLKAMHGS